MTGRIVTVKGELDQVRARLFRCTILLALNAVPTSASHTSASPGTRDLCRLDAAAWVPVPQRMLRTDVRRYERKVLGRACWKPNEIKFVKVK